MDALDRHQHIQLDVLVAHVELRALLIGPGEALQRQGLAGG